MIDWLLHSEGNVKFAPRDCCLLLSVLSLLWLLHAYFLANSKDLGRKRFSFLSVRSTVSAAWVSAVVPDVMESSSSCSFSFNSSFESYQERVEHAFFLHSDRSRWSWFLLLWLQKPKPMKHDDALVVAGTSGVWCTKPRTKRPMQL